MLFITVLMILFNWWLRIDYDGDNDCYIDYDYKDDRVVVGQDGEVVIGKKIYLY